ncbi:class I adenylate-forming enzyme family protein [Sphingomonas mucosissima]|uniref:Long-chain-fatty-acid--CoA ligase FadD13 n=1 Tax=Sphingomonas mucosissima TaxID=370959 RepID=A0A245ZHH0_9SPHN|nr:class I adenylate-forming enzyme family protein [Sphingomonas mucosissima]OWK29192.1 long-chain-fatty-acid--CoA ligase FadD13 [Sphingomonas mucosissima]
MKSELDLKMDATMAALTGEGGPLALGSIERFGQTLPIIAAAPPTLPAYFAHYSQQHAATEFLVAGAERLTYAEIYAKAQEVASALVSGFGVKKGDRVGIAARNSPSWIVIYMGILMAGGVATLLNGWWQSEELQAGVEDVGCTLVFADPPRCKRLAALPQLSAIVVEFDDLKPLATALEPIVAKAAGDATMPALGPDDHATILFTSGSTGQSKGALSTHRQVTQGVFNYLGSALMMLALAAQEGQASGLQPSTLLNVPLFHVTAEVPVFLQSFAIGRKLVLMPKWDAEEAMRLIEQEKITYFVGVPLMSFEMLNHPSRHKYDLSSVADIAAGGAPRPVEHVKRINEEMEGAPLIGYGLTETNGVGTGNWRTNYLAKPNSAGRPSMPLVDLAILDDAGKPVPQGERGEVSIRSAACFQEYWGKPEATQACYTADGYFLTGDIGYLDEDGYLFIVDRKKDIIIRGGENISCQEVEDALYQHAEVAEAAVFGLADEKFGEVPGAVVRLAQPGAVTVDDLSAFLTQHIAAFKVPQRIWLVSEPLPKLGTEKIDKVGLRNKYRTLAAAQAETSE